jgi:hypothetical protein
MNNYFKNIFAFALLIGLCGCSKTEDISEKFLIVKFKFDPAQARLNNIGQPSAIPVGHAAQTPDFRQISAHYFELAPAPTTLLGNGEILYHAPETNAGGSAAIDFSKSIIKGENEDYLKIPLKNIRPGVYQWIRVSLAYQKYGIKVRANNQDLDGTIESYVGYNTYITSHQINGQNFTVNGNRRQGYWAFALDSFPFSTSGIAPEGATTVPNPLFNTSPIPQGSCVVTGQFVNNLEIRGNETTDIIVTLSLSINKSFEWQEINADGKYEPSIGENVVDMGLRGLVPTHNQ